MRINATIKKWVRPVLPAVLAVSAIPAAHGASVALDVQMATPQMLTGARQKAYVRISLTGRKPRGDRRAVVNTAIRLRGRL